MRFVPFVLLAACAGEHTFLPPDTSVDTEETDVVDTSPQETDTVDTSDTGTDADGDGWTVEEGDCDDTTIWVNPAWPERPNDHKDNDCDGLVDEEFAGITMVDSGAGTKLVDVNLLGDVERTVSVTPTMTPAGVPAAFQIGPRISGEGWSFTDGAGKVGEIDATGAATVLWDDSATEYADGEAPLGYYGIAAHPDGWYAVSGGDRLWRVNPDGTATVLAQWDCLEGTEGVTEICPVDVAVDRFSGEVVLFGLYGGYAVWNEATGLDVAVLDNPETPAHQFWSTQLIDDGRRLAMGVDDAGTYGIFEWDEDTETFAMNFEWVALGSDLADSFTPVDFAIDQISRQYYATANRGWFVTAWRLVPGDANNDPYMAMLTPRTVDPMNSEYVQPDSDHDVQSILVRYSYAPEHRDVGVVVLSFQDGFVLDQYGRGLSSPSGSPLALRDREVPMSRSSSGASLLVASALLGGGCQHICGSTGWVPWYVNADCAIPFDTAGTDTADSDAGCEVELEVTVNGAASDIVNAGDTVALVAVARNVSDHAVTLSLVEQCPADEALFSGLGDGVDYYGTCAMGVCETTGQVFTRELAVGAELRIETAVDLGGSDCNAAVPAGAYDLSFALPTSNDAQPTLCGPVSATLTVQ